ncbi:Sucrase/ferredoxin-like protein [Corynebacterium occultum]|uniref:Sucrase/ferredoxin-like protein n=1 Tax=Corynebacterium occultum TaxID=2675219 RepID=A0A6B8VM06_9CORY|nr:sucrase ferredoxin [Corynebacterium occultum]QGU06512.1 Sucrase/ferredoxin-like protein [Corynebacterium occultum]
MSVSSRCSEIQVEPLPGTAKQEKVHVVLEHDRGWSRDVLDGDTFGPELSTALKSHLKGKAGLQLIRRPGQKHREPEHLTLFLVFTEEALVEKLQVTGAEAILDLDLSGPGLNAGEVVSHPLVLVCTHGKRDLCCAVQGRPLAAELAQRFPGDVVWETSHTKGHRFAPSILLMPWGYSFGRLSGRAASALVAWAQRGEFFLFGNRGRGLWRPTGQVAELAVARKLIDAGEPLHYGDLTVAEEGLVTHHDGRRWRVEMEKQEVTGVVSSCGDEPKVGSAWVAVSISDA